MNSLHFAAVLKAKHLAEPWALRYIEPAFNGDPDAAFSLSIALGNANRGAVAVLMWAAKVPREAYRTFLQAAWEHDHGHVIAYARTRRRLQAMFRYAAFPLPAQWSETITVWRGTSSVTSVQAAAGYSWTTNREVACWFAMRHAARKGAPLVLAADVNKTAVALFSDERDEAEAVILTHPDRARVDGCIAEWQMVFAKVQRDRHGSGGTAGGQPLTIA